MTKIRLLLVDDHAMVRMGLASLLGTRREFEVVGDAEDGEAAIRKTARLAPDVVVMDLMMPKMDGAETTQRLLEKVPGAKVLILTTFGSANGIAHALDVGARGAILKSADLDELIGAIKAVARGERFVASELEQILSRDPPVPELSPRQAEILASITRGHSNAKIADELGISVPMVKEHLNVLFSKIGATNRAEAIAIALRKHLLKI